MGTVLHLNRADPRIREVVALSFPNSPDFVDFLFSRVQDTGGSRETAQLIVQELLRTVEHPNVPVSKETIRRLSFDQDTRVAERLSRHLNGVIDGFRRKKLVLATRFSKRVELLPGAKSLSDHRVFQRAAVDTSQSVVYLHLFCCAVAMLLDLDFDPRAENDVT